MSRDLDVYAAQGFGRALGPGASWGLLLVDFQVGFIDPAGFGGGNIAAAAARSRALLAFARERRLPVTHTRVLHAEDGSDGNVFSARLPGNLAFTESNPASAIIPELAPVAGELVVRKTVPSAFFGSMLAAWLARQRVDTLLVAGCTTSGCVRASVVDAMSHGFRPIVVTDCVGDRALGPHEANLFDMRQKYADLMTLEAVIAAHAPAR